MKMLMIYLNIFIILLITSSVKCDAGRTDVTVSGISSGGSMATQMHIAFSKDISGCAILGSSPYFCCGNELAVTRCMAGPASNISIAELQSTIQSYRLSGSIDDPSNMKGDPVYVFSGTYDTVAIPPVVKLNEELYSHYGANIKTNYDLPAHHGFPTVDYGGICSELYMENFIVNCQFNMAYDLLNHLYGGNLIKPSTNVETPLLGQMILFSQEAFMNPPASLITDNTPSPDLLKWLQYNVATYNPDNWKWRTSGLFNLTLVPLTMIVSEKSANARSMLYSLDEQGLVYYPSACAKGKKCPMHVVFHGCRQAKTIIGDVFVRKTGYLEVAELNNIIIFFPQTIRSAVNPANPMACWDWWGYNTVDYANKNGPQMAAVKRMIDTIQMINKAFVRAK